MSDLALATLSDGMPAAFAGNSLKGISTSYSLGACWANIWASATISARVCGVGFVLSA